MRHEWETKDGEDILKLAVEDDGMFYRYPDDTRWRPTGGDPRAYRREILRLAEENAELRRQMQLMIDGRPADDPLPARVDEIAALKKTVDPLVAGIATLEAQLAEVREEALRLDRESRALKEELASWKESAIAERDLGRVVLEGSKAVGRRVAALEAENTALADECGTLIRERDALKSIGARLTLERDGWKAEAERLAAETREREEREEAPRDLATFFTYVEQANRNLALQAENERLRGDLALAVRKRPMPLSDGPPDLPLERKAFLAETPEDQWLLYREAAGWASTAREFEMAVERLRAESTTLKAKLDAIRGAAEASPHDCSLRQDVFFLLSVPNEGGPILPGEA